MEQKSQFTKGINQDLDPALTPNDQYLTASNIFLSGSEKFLAAENIQGTLELSTILGSFSGYVLGVYANKYSFNGSTFDGLTIFTAQSGGNFKILAHNLNSGSTYELFQQTFTSDFEASNPTIDAVVYPENGTDILYFTDNFNEIRKIRCEIPSPYVANFLNESMVSLQRRGAMIALNLDSIPTTGGSLLCGSYQFSLRLFNENRKSYTKFTLPSSPINISQVTSNVGLGSYNAVSTKYIKLRFDIPDEEFALYTHYQLAVIENTQATNILNASLLKLEDLTVSSIAGGFTTFYHDYKANTRIDYVPISDLVVDLAAIDHVKTLQVKNNKLFAGNVAYSNMEYDRTPNVTGSISRVTVDNTNDFQTSTRRGLFRDEVYREYISYYDDKYNFSRPKKLDLSAITGNQISNGDLKTPTKKQAGYTLLDGSDNRTNLILSLTIDNHPSWARGFVILRAKRKKRIKFQTPFIPSSLIEGIQVIGKYPTNYVSLLGTSGRESVVLTDSSPMNPVGTYLPKNFMFPVRRNYRRQVNDNNATRLQAGEVIIEDVQEASASDKVYFVCPPDVYTTDNAYTFADGDKFEVVDYAFLRATSTSFTSNTYEGKIGNFINTSVHTTLLASNNDDYYYSNAVTRSDPANTIKSGKVADYKRLDNLGQGVNISGNPVCQFNNLETAGVSFNTPPSNNALGVVLLDTSKMDSALYGHSSYGGSQLVSAGGNVVTNGFYELGEGSQSNEFCLSKVGYSNEVSYVSILDIANVVTEEQDDRYGDDEDIHEIVYTGANYTFNASQVTSIVATGAAPVTLSVAGGDCYTSLHQFKITDNHYGILNSEKAGAGAQLSEIEVLRRWGKIFPNKFEITAGYATDGDTCICMPVPYKNVSQVVAVVIESEVNGEVLGPRVYPIVSGRYQSEDTNEYNLRTPFPYIYNNNYSKQSDQKAFIPFNADESITTSFKSRGIFSDQKIYNTLIDGFDVFRTSSTFDLEETYGGITKLALDGDNLIALQESAIVYLPIDAQVTETADGQTLSIRSSTVVDIPRYISRQYGCQHIKSVKVIDEAIFFCDNNNQAVIKFQGKHELISEKGMIKEFNARFGTDIAENLVFGIYDNNRRHYWLSNRSTPFCWVYDDRFGCWVSNYDFPSNSLMDGLFAYNNMYLLGKEGSNLKVYKMYAGDYNSLFGTAVTPQIKFSINQDYEIAKTFDNIVIYSSDKLDTMDIQVEKETGQVGQEVLGLDIEVARREGNYRVAVVRDSQGARLRGTRAAGTIKWIPDNTKVSLSSVVTKYRSSERRI